MDIPQKLKDAMSLFCEAQCRSDLIKNSAGISKKYRADDRAGKRLVTDTDEVRAYCTARMPATYCAVYSALEHTLPHFDRQIKSVLDVGAGTGAASWAASKFFPAAKITCVEREPAMAEAGKRLMSHAESPLCNSEWIIGDISSGLENSADCVVASYVLNELAAEQLEACVRRLWNSTTELLLLVEPGTPLGYSNIMRARAILLEEGANITAPCTHERQCPLGKDDWCAFSCRVARSKEHKLAKGGDAPYEDEKFSFLAVSRSAPNELPECRILRHPQISSGFVRLTVCRNDASEDTVAITKKYGALYKFCRKASAGDCFNLVKNSEN